MPLSITIRKRGTRYNDTQQNGTRYCWYRYTECLMLYLSSMRSVINKPIMLSVIMPSVAVPSAVAPFRCYASPPLYTPLFEARLNSAQALSTLPELLRDLNPVQGGQTYLAFFPFNQFSTAGSIWKAVCYQTNLCFVNLEKKVFHSISQPLLPLTSGINAIENSTSVNRAAA